MKASPASGAVVATIIAVLLAACGSDDTGSAEPTRPRTTVESPSPGESTGTPGDRIAPGRHERITPGGIAAVVLDHLGRDTVRQFITFSEGGEPGSVGIMIRLRDRTPHNFSLGVSSPKAATGWGRPGMCPPRPHRKGESSRCRVLDNGTTVVTGVEPYGFSDDNKHGVTLFGSTITRHDGMVQALYESYDDTPALTLIDLEALISDPRLTWLTDPAVNKAGETVELKQVTG